MVQILGLLPQAISYVSEIVFLIEWGENVLNLRYLELNVTLRMSW